MNYKILADEYFKEASTLKQYIKNLKKYEIQNADDLNFKYRIKMLYEMYLEMKNTGEYLMYKFEVINSGKKQPLLG